MNDSLSWKRQIFVSVIKRYIVVVTLLSILIGILVSFTYYKTASTDYSAKSQLVQNDNNTSLISSYSQFMSSTQFQSSLRSKINQSTWKKYSKKYDYDVAIKTETNSPFFYVNATSQSANYSIFIVNTSTKIIIQNMGQYLTGANIGLVSQAKEATVNSINNKLVKIGGFGFIISFVLIFCLLIVLRLFLGVIPDESFTQDSFRITNLGTLDISTKSK